MKRVGKRGEGKFERISWDEALDTIASSLKKTVEQYGNEAVYIQYCLHNNLAIMPSLAEERIMQEEKLDKFSTNEPVIFNRIFANRDIKVMALIEKLIARGELIRLSHNQNITTPTGEMIGANIKEAIAWFKNPDNISAVNAYKNKLKVY